jgi:hypothetical protein
VIGGRACPTKTWVEGAQAASAATQRTERSDNRMIPTPLHKFYLVAFPGENPWCLVSAHTVPLNCRRLFKSPGDKGCASRGRLPTHSLRLVEVTYPLADCVARRVCAICNCHHSNIG